MSLGKTLEAGTTVHKHSFTSAISPLITKFENESNRNGKLNN